MVSAVFHSPLDASDTGSGTPSTLARTMTNIAISPEATGATGQKSLQNPGYDWRGLWLAVLPPLMGLGLLVGLWALVSISGGDFQRPVLPQRPQ